MTSSSSSTTTQRRTALTSMAMMAMTLLSSAQSASAAINLAEGETSQRRHLEDFTPQKPMEIGRPFDTRISSDASVSDIKPALISESDGGITHVYDIVHKDASFISLHFASANVREGCSIVINDLNGSQQQTTITSENQEKRKLSHHINGDSVRMLVACEVLAYNVETDVSFEIDYYIAGFSNEEIGAGSSASSSKAAAKKKASAPNLFEKDVENEGRALSRLRGVASTQQRDLAICGTSQHMDAACLKKEGLHTMYNKAMAVARLIIGGTRSCTGFLIGNSNYFMTNHHCISSQEDVDSTDFEFMTEDVCGGTSSDQLWFNVRGERLDDDDHEGDHIYFAYHEELDFVLIKLAGNPMAKYGSFDLAESARAEEKIWIPQHPRARAKDVSYEDQTYADKHCRLKNGFQYSCDTEGGSSGSPIVSRDTNKVIGIHHSASGSCTNKGSAAETFFTKIEPIIYETEAPTSSPTASPTSAPTEGPQLPENLLDSNTAKQTKDGVTNTVNTDTATAKTSKNGYGAAGTTEAKTVKAGFGNRGGRRAQRRSR